MVLPSGASKVKMPRVSRWGALGVKKPRIRIFDTIGYGFYFAISHYGSLLRLTWLPAVVAILVFNLQTSAQIMARRGDLPEAGFLPEYTAFWVWLPIYALLSIPAVAAYRMAVFNQRAPRGLAYFRLGGTELQFLASQLIVGAYMMIYVILVMAVLIVPASFGAHQLLSAAAPVAASFGLAPPEGLNLNDEVTMWLRIGAGASVAAAVAYLFGIVLFSLVQPVVVVERRIGIWRALRLVWLGNALRLSFVWFVAGVTLLGISGVLYMLAEQYMPGLVFKFFPNFDQRNLLHYMIAVDIITILPSILIGTLVLGVSAGINGFAYRQIAFPRHPHPPAAHPAEDASEPPSPQEEDGDAEGEGPPQ